MKKVLLSLAMLMAVGVNLSAKPDQRGYNACYADCIDRGNTRSDCHGLCKYYLD